MRLCVRCYFSFMGLICLFEIIAYILIGNIMSIKIKFTRRRAQTSQLRILCCTTFDFDFMHGAVIACILSSSQQHSTPSSARAPGSASRSKNTKLRTRAFRARQVGLYRLTFTSIGQEFMQLTRGSHFGKWGWTPSTITPCPLCEF